ncbi:phosphocholine cytidylyltransferase family protein [Streptacidiphilus pinicola]|uniref:Phosphocholine cytidylyltransferase family protein n=1 Tax=Streptacidiphilus pinicola TaxID=2219663 RepID=A0A2X0KAZ3_9ACTN|nr:phosphocholine cytidylyltransferase family protein [Streptacidiphilus pinicola]RAG86345.1 phosphocholine cytidylyltransferase family protein [Streptacidiphilus pinicola]
MHAVILAAGRGSRLGAHTDTRPKCLVDLHGRSLLQHQLAALGDAGVTGIAAVTGYQAEQIAAHVPTTFHAPRWQQTNMVVSLTAARPWLSTRPCLVAYGDIFYSASTAAALFHAPGENLAIAYDPGWLELWRARFADPLDDCETFRLDAGNSLLEIGRTPTDTGDVQGQYMGLLRFTPSSWAQVEEHLDGLGDGQRDALDMTSLLGALVARGVTVDCVARTGPWGEVDTPGDLEVYSATALAALNDYNVRDDNS